jgi:hypothetical protein
VFLFVQETDFTKGAMLKNAIIYGAQAFIEAHVDAKIVYYRNKKFLKVLVAHFPSAM